LPVPVSPAISTGASKADNALDSQHAQHAPRLEMKRGEPVCRGGGEQALLGKALRRNPGVFPAATMHRPCSSFRRLSRLPRTPRGPPQCAVRARRVSPTRCGRERVA
jgi:hypothetical protein